MNEEKKGEEEEPSGVEYPEDEILENQEDEGVVGVEDPLVELKL